MSKAELICLVVFKQKKEVYFFAPFYNIKKRFDESSPFKPLQKKEEYLKSF